MPMELMPLTMRDLDRLKVLQEALEGRLTQRQAAEQLDLSDRQVRRLCRRLEKRGPKGIIHGLRGRDSNRQLATGLLERALKLVKEHYSDFGPTFACEKLAERDGIALAVNTLRKGMIHEGLWRPRRHKPFHRAWRPRKACVGEMIQVDGSDHDWFEGRGPRCWLIAFVDDATSRLMWAEFADSEDTLTLMRLAGVYLRRHGRPLSFYVDKDSIYKTSRQADADEDLREELPMTQFTRAMSELEINVICANSPQAKGRVERGFKTHQNRLVKEMRLAGISSKQAANDFLRQKYFAAHNKRFAVAPASHVDAHRRLYPDQKLDRILSLRVERTVLGDFTVRWKKRFFQLLEQQPTRVKPGDKIQVEVRLDDTVYLRRGQLYLAYKTIAKGAYRPFLQARPSELTTKHRPPPLAKVAPYKPRPDHPWKKLFLKPRMPANANAN